MITFFRIDERLIHGQVVIKWSRHTGVDRIIVANDLAAGSEMMQKALMMAAPRHIKTVIKTVTEAIELLKDPRAEALKILLLVDSPEDALKIVKNVEGIPFLNIGNYGRVAKEKPGKPRKSYGLNIYVDDEEYEVFKEILAMGIKCVYQTIPEEPVEELANLLGIK